MVIVGVMLAVMWGTEIIDLLPGVALDGWGIRPRTVRGLFGIVFAPFLHAGFGHLIANTIPFAVLGAVIALEGTRQIVEVTAMVALVSGAGVWLFGASNSVHLGASGVVFGFITYLVDAGLVRRQAAVDPRWSRRRRDLWRHACCGASCRRVGCRGWATCSAQSAAWSRRG